MDGDKEASRKYLKPLIKSCEMIECDDELCNVVDDGGRVRLEGRRNVCSECAERKDRRVKVLKWKLADVRFEDPRGRRK